MNLLVSTAIAGTAVPLAAASADPAFAVAATRAALGAFRS
jgi:hypothetical protein